MANSKNLRLAFFKAEYGEWDDSAIDKVTGGGGFSHCEVMLRSDCMVGAHYLAGGVTKNYYNDILNDKRWVVIELELGNENAIHKMEEMMGVGYDIVGVTTKSILRTNMFIDHEKVWCSELCAIAINHELEKKIVNTFEMPNGLYKILMDDFNAKIISKGLASRRKPKAEIDRFGRVRIKTKDKVND